MAGVFKVSFTAETDVDVWVEADNAEHAESLVTANNRETYGRIKSSVSVESGSIRINTPTIAIHSVEDSD